MAGRTATIPQFENLYSQVPFSGHLVLASHPWNFHEPLMVLTIVNGVIFLPLDNFMSNGTTQFKRIAVEKGLIIPFCSGLLLQGEGMYLKKPDVKTLLFSRSNRVNQSCKSWESLTS